MNCMLLQSVRLRRILPMLLAVVLLAGCSAETPLPAPSESSSATSSAEPVTSLTTPGTSATNPGTTAPSGEASLYIVFDLEQPQIYELPNTGILDASVLLQGLSGLTGWNCDVNHVEILSGIARVDLAQTALPFTWTGQEQGDFFCSTYVDTVFLFLDSIQRTLMNNLALAGVIFTQNDGQTLQLDRLHAAVELFPADTAYRGSSYYRALLMDSSEFTTDEYEYEMLQLACGMNVWCPKCFQPDGEGDTEYHMVYEQGDQIATIVWHEYMMEPVPDDSVLSVAMLELSQQLLTVWIDHLTAMGSVTSTDSQTATSDGYELDGTIGTYRIHVTGFLVPARMAYYEVVFLYDPALSNGTPDSFPGMETIVRDVSYALSHFN